MLWIVLPKKKPPFFFLISNTCILSYTLPLFVYILNNESMCVHAPTVNPSISDVIPSQVDIHAKCGKVCHPRRIVFQNTHQYLYIISKSWNVAFIVATLQLSYISDHIIYQFSTIFLLVLLFFFLLILQPFLISFT